MKTRNIILTIASLLMVVAIAKAQDTPTEALETTQSKTYTVDMGNETVRRTVEISTMRSTSVELDKKDSTKINQSRIVGHMGKITKTVKIDNDADDAFDEKIVFTYTSDAPEDFILITNNNELSVAIEDGENLKIIENMSLKSKKESDNIQTYVYTDKKGKEIEFWVQEYTKNTRKVSDSK